MTNAESTLASLEAELTSIEENALEDEQRDVRHTFSLLENEIQAIALPYPDVKPYDTGMDYDDISVLQFKKGENKLAQMKREAIQQYLDCNSLFVGHLELTGGSQYYIMDYPELRSKSTICGEAISLINADDKAYVSLLNAWRYPKSQSTVSFSRKLSMRGRKVTSVEVLFDKSNQLASSITDGFLRKALLRNKLKPGLESIIQTIQEMQDTIRLLPKGHSFIVQGCAGSGKTMILLHRLRYLLYNHDIEPEEFFLLIPTYRFGTFIKDICAQFKIGANRILPVQAYYQLLAGEKRQGVQEDTDEQIFSPEFLRRVYSREFIQDAYRMLARSLREQTEILTSACETVLGELLKKTENDLNDRISYEQQNAVSLSSAVIERIQPALSVKPASYSDLPAVREEILEAYIEAEKRQQNALAGLEPSPEETESILCRDSRILHLQDEMNAEEERVSSANIFTVIGHRRKLNTLKEQYTALRSQVATEIREAEIQRRKEQAVNAGAVYEGVSLEEVKGILSNLSFISEAAGSAIEEATQKLGTIEEDIMRDYAHEIEALNELIASSVTIEEECAEAVTALEPAGETLSRYIRAGSELYSSFSPLCSAKDKKRLEARCKLFRERGDLENTAYLSQLLFTFCKRLAREEYGVRISRAYKHYWYLNVYCQYLSGKVRPSPQSYLYIDEAQDLSPSEIELLRKMNARRNGSSRPVYPIINLFGDVNQTITLHGTVSWNSISEIGDVRTLDENFRNTNQIIEFCNQKLSHQMKQMGVEGEEVVEFASLEKALPSRRKILSQYVFIVKDGYALKDLEDLFAFHGIGAHEAYTVKQAKGLEFKQVCVFDTGMTEAEAYIAYTRALISLMVIHKLPLNEENHVAILPEEDEEDTETELEEAGE